MKNKRKKCAYIGETRRRSWLKSLIWRITGIFILGGLSWLITHDLEVARHAGRIVSIRDGQIASDSDHEEKTEARFL